MGRAPCCDKANVKRGPWSPEEDATLKSYLQAHGTGGNWIALPKKAGLRRCGKSCRLRWLNYLRPDIKHGGFTDEEDHLICNLYSQMGSRWSVIASQLPGRTDNDVKNYWNTKLKKKLLAGKISLTTNSTTNGQLLIPANNVTSLPGPITKPSILQVPNSPRLPKVETFDSSTIPNSDTRNSAASRILTDIDNSVLTFYDHRSFRLQYDPELIDFSADQFHHVRTKNSDISSNNVTMSQEGSSNISDSSLQASSDVKRALVAPHNGCDEYTGHGSSLMDFGFGSPYDIVDFMSFEERADNYHDSTCCISFSDLAFEIRPRDQRQNQNIINDFPRN